MAQSKDPYVIPNARIEKNLIRKIYSSPCGQPSFCFG